MCSVFHILVHSLGASLIVIILCFHFSKPRTAASCSLRGCSPAHCCRLSDGVSALQRAHLRGTKVSVLLTDINDEYNQLTGQFTAAGVVFNKWADLL